MSLFRSHAEKESMGNQQNQGNKGPSTPAIAAGWERSQLSGEIGEGQAPQAGLGLDLTELHILTDSGESSWQVWANTLQNVFAGILSYEQVMMLAYHPMLREVFLRLLNQARQEGVNGSVREAWTTANEILLQNQASMDAAGAGTGGGGGEVLGEPDYTYLGSMLAANEHGVLMEEPEQSERIRQGYIDTDILPTDKRYDILEGALGGFLGTTKIWELAKNVRLSKIFLHLWENRNKQVLATTPEGIFNVALQIEAQAFGGTAEQDIETYIAMYNAPKRVRSNTTTLPDRFEPAPEHDWEEDMRILEAQALNLEPMQRFQLANSVPMRQGYEYLGENKFAPHVRGNQQLRFKLAQRAAQSNYIKRLNEEKADRKRQTPEQLARLDSFGEEEKRIFQRALGALLGPDWPEDPIKPHKRRKENRRKAAQEVLYWEARRPQVIWQGTPQVVWRGTVIEYLTIRGQASAVGKITVRIFAGNRVIVWTQEDADKGNVPDEFWDTAEWVIERDCWTITAQVQAPDNASGQITIKVLDDDGQVLGEYTFTLGL